jgi:hypothetical protein
MATIRRIGFEPVERVVELHTLAPTELSVSLTKFVPVLETVRISALSTLGLDRVGFAARQKLGAGTFLSSEQLNRWNNPRLSDALRTVPSLRTGRTATGETTISGRFGDCVRYFVDGHKWMEHGDGPDTFLGGPEIGAIEVYTPQFAPAEFMAYGWDGRPCAAVVVWTKWKLGIK